MGSAELLPLDVERLRAEWKLARPFPHVMIEPFLTPESAAAVARAYPPLTDARRVGHEFQYVNETGKVQITDAAKFPPVVRSLHEILASSEFLANLEAITGIPRLLADAELAGGGMHLTGPRGRLDVHVDFNFIESKRWHRRMNLLLYLNEEWRDEWGGGVELWDRRVRVRERRFAPFLNRCVIFETSDISYHGVEQVKCPPGTTRQSFATYYYTTEAPPSWKGHHHSTIFRARPDERMKAFVLMPAERAVRVLRSQRDRAVRFAKRRLKIG